jgi:hypothetical protein
VISTIKHFSLKVNGEYAGGDSVLIEDVLKSGWGYPGASRRPRASSTGG